MTNLYFWRRDFNASLASPLYVCNTPINWPLTELTPWILTRDSTHMAPAPLLWSRSQSKLELGTNPFLCPAAVSGEVCNQDNSITAIYRHIPTWNLHSRKLTFPALTNSANTHMSISNIRVPQFCHRHCDEYTIIRIGVCQTHVRSTK